MNIESSVQQIPTTAAQVRQQILQRLGTQWQPGDRLPPLAELSRQLGVGQRSTYQAMRDLCNAGLLVARQGKGTFVSASLDERQVRDALRVGVPGGGGALPLAGKSVRILTATMHPVAMIQQMAQAAEASLRDAGASVVRDQHPLLNDLRTLADRGDDALVLVNPSTSSPIQFDPRQKLAVVSTTAHLLVAAGEGFDLVSPNEEQGGFLAGRYLRQLGCRTPAFVGAADPTNPAEYDGTCRTRLRGFEAGFGEAVPASRRFMTKRYGLSAGACALTEYQCLAQRPDAIFAASDELMVGFIAGAIAIGLQHGRDYQIVGFDGQQHLQHADEQPLSSVIVPAAELGRQAADLLIERLRHPGTPARQLSIGCAMPNPTANNLDITASTMQA